LVETVASSLELIASEIDKTHDFVGAQPLIVVSVLPKF
jgi:hypothetical protein